MSEEKSSPIGIIVVAAFFVGKSGDGNGDQNAGNQQQPANGSDTNKTVQPPSPQKKANGSDADKTAPQPKPAEPKEPAEPEEPAFVKEGLVAYYPFNGNAKDESGNGHDGEVKGSALTQDRHSNADSAYEFTVEGISHISIPESDTLRPEKMTLNAWVYLSQEGAEERFNILFKEESVQLAIDNTGKLQKVKNFFGLNTGGFGRWKNLEYMGRFPAGEWFMYTATYDGATMRQHLNSQEICSGRFTGAVFYENSHKYPFLIGSIQSSRGNLNLANKLDDVRIYNRALSAEELKALYDLEKPKK